jgi:hypothetical protein
MKLYLFKAFFLLAIIMAGVVVQAQTTQGTDFYVSFGSNNSNLSSAVNLQVRIVAIEATKVDFSFTGASQQNITANVAAGSVHTLSLSTDQKAAVYSTTAGLSSKSLYIHSDKPVSVYVLNQYTATTDATNVLPINSLGTEYYHISYLPLTGRSDGYTIVATEAGTDIFENGTKLTTMNTGQVYSVYKTTDMTGSHITSSKPIALFNTNVQTLIPDNKTGNSDNLYQQMMPVRTWGKRYFVPVTRRGTERVRIVASQDGTTITQMGGTLISGSLTNLNKGQFVELEINLAAGGSYIAANKPVGVCSF